MTERHLSPIERMVDEACGMGRRIERQPMVRLLCRQCKRIKHVERHETDPEGTSIVEALCDRCDDGVSKSEVHYYDAQGRWFDGEKFRTVGEQLSND